MAEARCRFCGAEFSSRLELRRHYIEFHRIERPPENEPDEAERPETDTDTDADGSSQPGGAQGRASGAGGTA